MREVDKKKELEGKLERQRNICGMVARSVGEMKTVGKGWEGLGNKELWVT